MKKTLIALLAMELRKKVIHHTVLHARKTVLETHIFNMLTPLIILVNVFNAQIATALTVNTIAQQKRLFVSQMVVNLDTFFKASDGESDPSC